MYFAFQSKESEDDPHCPITPLAAGLLAVAAPAAAQYPDPAPRLAAQRQAMARLAFMDGVWRGPAWSLTPAGGASSPRPSGSAPSSAAPSG